MAFVQVKIKLQTWKMAAFIVAFFSPFLHADLYSAYETKDVSTSTGWSATCTAYSTKVGDEGSLPDALTLSLICANAELSSVRPNVSFTGYCQSPSYSESVINAGSYYIMEVVRTCASGFPSSKSIPNGGTDLSETTIPSCEDTPDYPVMYGDKCFREQDMNEISEINDYCDNLVLDTGNNTSNYVCYTNPSGTKSCDVGLTTFGDTSYYSGTDGAVFGCDESQNEKYDSDGTGNSEDNCIYSGGTNYCSADRNNYCSSVGGTEICEDGCLDIGTSLYCDTSRHPDVGDGSDNSYFDDTGTCSVISASSTRGFCEDMGGEWTDGVDYQETSCSSGTGSCSVATAGLCNACLDAGGTWTPDDTVDVTPETQAAIETAALLQKSNDKLTQIEHGQRSTMDSMKSAIESGNDKLVSAVEKMSEKMDSEEEEKETFTTTTSDVDKSAFKSMFNSTAQAAVQARVDTAQENFNTKAQAIYAEAKTLLTVTVPAAVGYQARDISLKFGQATKSVDVSLNRFSDFFKSLAGPIMLLCSLIALLALLRD